MAFTNSQGRTQSSLSDINITPFVDVMLVLLIIFMLTAPIIQSGIEVDVPHTTTVKEITEPRLVLTMDRNQNVFLGDKPINLNQLPSILKEQVKDPQHHPIYLRCDENVTFGAFAALMDTVKQSGITNISIVTQPYQTKNAAR
jgi:biopolymer transport protein TolR